MRMFQRRQFNNNLEDAKMSNKIIVIIFIILLLLGFVILILTAEYSDKGDNACKEIGYTKLFGNSLRGYTCVSDEKSIRVELECGVTKCEVYPIT